MPWPLYGGWVDVMQFQRVLLLLTVLAFIASGTACKPAAKPARVWFVEPADGAEVKSPVKLKFGVEGMTVKPAGDVVPESGHHHIIVDGAGIDKGTTVPKDATHIHFGKGQTEAEIELSPGEHTLTLQFADGAHNSFGAPLSQTIRIKVTGK